MGATSVRKESSVLDVARITRVRVRRAWRDAALTSLLGVLLIPYFLGCCAIRERYNRLDVPVGAYEPEQPNPLFVQTDDPEALWDAIVDVIDNYFVISTENPVRTYERTDENGKRYYYRTEGRIDTEPSIMGGVQEPWRRNGSECGDRWFATFQTVRSYAYVRVTPEEKGFFIYLTINREIEDMPRPIGSNVDYNLRFNDDLSQLSQAVGERSPSKGWIDAGRATDLEARVMKEIAWRVGVPRTVIHEGIDANLQP